MIAEPLEKGLAEDIENEVVQITWNRWADLPVSRPEHPSAGLCVSPLLYCHRHCTGGMWAGAWPQEPTV